MDNAIQIWCVNIKCRSAKHPPMLPPNGALLSDNPCPPDY